MAEDAQRPGRPVSRPCCGGSLSREGEELCSVFLAGRVRRFLAAGVRGALPSDLLPELSLLQADHECSGRPHPLAHHNDAVEQ